MTFALRDDGTSVYDCRYSLAQPGLRSRGSIPIPTGTPQAKNTPSYCRASMKVCSCGRFPNRTVPESGMRAGRLSALPMTFACFPVYPETGYAQIRLHSVRLPRLPRRHAPAGSVEPRGLFRPCSCAGWPLQPLPTGLLSLSHSLRARSCTAPSGSPSLTASSIPESAARSSNCSRSSSLRDFWRIITSRDG